MDIKEDSDLTQLVSVGLAFVREITERYGVEDGTKVWQSIAESVDPEAKGAIMFAMLTGNNSNVVTLRQVPDGMKVNAIKVVRQYTGLGLKEAKDQVDIVMGHVGGYYTGQPQKPIIGQGPVKFKVGSYENARKFVKDLRDVGCIAD